MKVIIYTINILSHFYIYYVCAGYQAFCAANKVQCFLVEWVLE